MNWKVFINDKSKQAFDQLVEKYPEGPAGFALNPHDYDYAEVRHKLLDVHREAKEKASLAKTRGTYAYDLEFAIGMYDCLSKCGFGLWQAADIGCWAYLSIRVIPDIVYDRWGGYNADRFYKRNKRRWLMSLWWYIHLAENGEGDFNAEEVRELLCDYSQDLIYLLLDHSGGGFRDTLYHVLLKKCREICETKKMRGSREDFFRAVMLQHQVRSAVVDPVLEGEEDYVDELLAPVLPRFTED